MTLKVFITAGEVSGDMLGARLMSALRTAHSDIEFSGVGGAAMAAQGLQSLFPMTDLSVMGIAEVVPRLPKILGRIRQTARAVADSQPDIFISIDAPDFSFRVAQAIKAQNGPRPKMIHYVAPTVWAWRADRAAKVADLYDGIICLLPFEPPYFEREGMKAAFVGHAMLESGLMQGDGTAFRLRHNIPMGVPVMGVMFGSRMGELNRMGPVLRAAALQMAKGDSSLHIVSPTLPHLAREALNLLQRMPCAIHVIGDPVEKADAFKSMDFAVATSGTVGLELAVADVPHIIGYKLSAMTARMIRNKIRTKYAHLANILLEQEAVPEFLQEKCVPPNLVAALRTLKHDRMATMRQRQAFERARSMIRGAKTGSPSVQAAEFVLVVARGQ